MSDLLRLLQGQTLDLSARSWQEILMLADRTQCTPLLRDLCTAPEWVLREIQDRVGKVQARRSRLLETCEEAVRTLSTAGIDFVVLKGFTHELDAKWDISMRVQNDIDILCSGETLARAQAALTQQGYRFHSGPELSDNHLRPLLKPHTWTWKGDYFDPERPVTVELHHTIWNSARDRIAISGLEDFWTRRETLAVDGLALPAFGDADRLCIAALHLLRHALRNNVRPIHAYELARMLSLRAADAGFWVRWQRHPSELRTFEAIAFRFAMDWFGGELSPSAQVAWMRAPRRVHAWFDCHSRAPLFNLSAPNKHVLSLHLALLNRWQDKAAVMREKLMPLRFPRRGQAVAEYRSHVLSRTRYHAVALARTVWSGVRSAAQRSIAAHTSD